MSLIQVVGIGLSALALAGLLVALVELATRRGLVLLGRRLAGWRGGLGRLGLALLGLGAFFAGVYGIPVASEDRARRGRGLEARAVTTTWRLPFYVETRTRHLSAEGEPTGEEARHTLQLPWAFLLWLAIYAVSIGRPGSGGLTGRSGAANGAPRAPAGSR